MEPLGIDMVKLGLQDVLYDPKNKQVYIPNTNKIVDLGKGGVSEGQELNSEPKMEKNLSSLTDMST